MAFPYIGGQIPQPRNPVEVASQAFLATQQGIANHLKMGEQKQYNKAYPQMLQNQMGIQEAELATARTNQQYAGPQAEAALAKSLADIERMNIENQYAAPMNDAALASQLAQIEFARAQVNTQYQQARSYEADYAKKMHELANWDLYLQGTSGDLFRQMYAAERLGGMNGSNSGINNTDTSAGQSGMGQAPQLELAETRVEQTIFDKVLSSQDDATRSMAQGMAAPSNARDKSLKDIEKGIAESFLSPYDKKLNEAAAKEEAEAQFKVREDIKISAESASAIDYQLNRAEENYAKLGSAEKGPLFGSLPAATGEANAVDSSVKSMLEQLLARMQGRGALSDVDVKNAESTLPNRSFTEAGFEEATGVWRQINGRVKEHSSFMQDAINIKKLPTAIAEQMWSTHVINNPLGYGEPSAEDALDELMRRGVNNGSK